MGGVGAVGEEVEAGTTGRPRLAHQNEGPGAHFPARARHAVGQQPERVGGQLVALQPTGPVGVLAQPDARLRPLGPDLAAHRLKLLVDARVQAVDVQVQLVLAAAVDRVHRDAGLVARQRPPELGGDEAPLIPGWVSGDQVSFRDDIYGWDEETLKALDTATVKRA